MWIFVVFEDMIEVLMMIFGILISFEMVREFRLWMEIFLVFE